MTYLMQVYGVYHCWFNQHFDLCMILMGSARVGDALWPPPTPPLQKKRLMHRSSEYILEKEIFLMKISKKLLRII